MATSRTADPQRFFDPDGPPGQPAVIELQRIGAAGDSYRLLRRIGYDDVHRGSIVVPAALDDFDSDLTSVPSVFQWLVPRTGSHLIAALLHDGMVLSPGEDPTYVADAPIDRVEADRIFRDAMADSNTPWLRRWLVWTAVTLATIFEPGGLDTSPVRRWALRVVAAATVAVILILGYLATVDLLDATDDVWFSTELPWMGDRSAPAELAGGLAGAIVIPLVLALLWGRQFFRAGVIVGIALSLLLHVTVLVSISLAAYYGAEQILRKVSPTVVRAAAAVVVAAAVVTFVVALG